ncbi:MAG: hypothetical protein M3506_08500, partial [Chloroflexota bacterium]|nr:hypothetical protein [Chloroflexota bacterium]
MSPQTPADPASNRPVADLWKILAGVIALITIAWLLNSYFATPFRLVFSFIAFLALWFPLLCLSLLAGHLGFVVAGKLLGFQLVTFIYGPWKLSRKLPSPKPRWSRNRCVELYTGMVTCSPLDERGLPRRIERYVAAGLTGTLILSLNLSVLALITRDSAVGWLFTAIAIMSIVLSWSVWNNTRRLLGSLRSDDVMDVYAAQQLIGGLELVQGVRPCDWPPELVDRAQRLRDDSAAATLGARLAFMWALDRGDVAATGEYMARMLEMQPIHLAAVRRDFLLDAAYYEAFHRNDAAAARQLMERATGAVIEQHTRLRAE